MKTYIKPNILIVKQMGAMLMLDTSGGSGPIVTPPQSKGNDVNDLIHPRSLWDSDEEE